MKKLTVKALSGKLYSEYNDKDVVAKEKMQSRVIVRSVLRKIKLR